MYKCTWKIKTSGKRQCTKVYKTIGLFVLLYEPNLGSYMLWAASVTEMEGCRSPKTLLFKEVVSGRQCRGAAKKSDPGAPLKELLKWTDTGGQQPLTTKKHIFSSKINGKTNAEETKGIKPELFLFVIPPSAAATIKSACLMVNLASHRRA